MPSVLITVPIADSGSSSPNSIWSTRGKVTRLVAIDLPLPSDPSSASELSRLADTSGDKLRILTLNVTDPASVSAAAAELDGQAIDLLLNNADVMGARGQAIGNIDYKARSQLLDFNTIGPARDSEAFVDHVARSERKLIVNP